MVPEQEEEKNFLLSVQFEAERAKISISPMPAFYLVLITARSFSTTPHLLTI
jgi:hypothetical protein